MSTVSSSGTGCVDTLNRALVLPPGIVTLVGTDARFGESLDRSMTSPAAGAFFAKCTTPVGLTAPPFPVEGFSEIDLRVEHAPDPARLVSAASMIVPNLTPGCP